MSEIFTSTKDISIDDSTPSLQKVYSSSKVEELVLPKAEKSNGIEDEILIRDDEGNPKSSGQKLSEFISSVHEHNADAINLSTINFGGVLDGTVDSLQALADFIDDNIGFGAGLEFDWNGTSLGVRVEGASAYEYVELKGETGDSLEFLWNGTQLGVRVEGNTSYSYVDLVGTPGISGTNGTDGDNLEFLWNGTQLGVRVEGGSSYTYRELKGEGLEAGGTTGQALFKKSNDDYDTEWLDIDGVTSGVDSVNGETGVVVLTTDDIAEDTDSNYVTDAEKTVVGNTSGINTGDQDISGLITGPASSVDNGIALFNGTTGKIIKDSTKTIVTSLGSDDTTIPTSKAVGDAIDSSGGGDMIKTTYDTNDNGIVDNSEKVNGLTVETAVPNGAVFTDTTYTDSEIKTKYENNTDTNAFTDDEKSKLSWIEENAEVNVVDSVAGKTGDVTLNKGDVGLGNVDNTSDADKPVSTAQQTALNDKANLAGGNTFTGNQIVDDNLLIGTATSSGAKLDVADAKSIIRLIDTQDKSGWTIGEISSGLEFYKSDTSGGGAGIGSSINSVNLGDSYGSHFGLSFSTTNNGVLSEKMLIKEDGNVLIGTSTSSGAKLDVAGDAKITGELIVGDHGTGTTDQVVNTCYGTSETPPTASGTTEGTIYIQYTE